MEIPLSSPLTKADGRVAEDRAVYDATGRVKLLEEIKETLDIAAADLPAPELHRIRDQVRFMVHQARREFQDEGKAI